MVRVVGMILEVVVGGVGGEGGIGVEVGVGVGYIS